MKNQKEAVPGDSLVAPSSSKQSVALFTSAFPSSIPKRRLLSAWWLADLVAGMSLVEAE